LRIDETPLPVVSHQVIVVAKADERIHVSLLRMGEQIILQGIDALAQLSVEHQLYYLV